MDARVADLQQQLRQMQLDKVIPPAQVCIIL